MKDIIGKSRKIIRSISEKREDYTLLPEIIKKPIEEPDAEVIISPAILNDLLQRNFPFSTAVPLDENQNIDISISAAEISFTEGNRIELAVTDAGIKYGRRFFRIGVHSNRVELTLTAGVMKSQDRFRLLIFGEFSCFDIRYLPSWLENRLVDLLRRHFLSPVLDRDITDLLTMEKEIDLGRKAVRIVLKPEEIVAAIDRKGIRLQAAFRKMAR